MHNMTDQVDLFSDVMRICPIVEVLQTHTHLLWQIGKYASA